MQHHSGASPEHSDRPQRPTVNLKGLQAPKTALGQAQRAIDQAIDEKMKFVTDTIVAHLERDNHRIANTLSFWHPDNRGITPDAMHARIEKYKANMTAFGKNAIPELLDYTTLPVPAGIDPKALKTECEKQKEEAIAMAVNKAIRQVLGELRETAEKERRAILDTVKSTKFTDFTREGIKKWVDSAHVDETQRQLAADIGLDRSPVSLKAHRGLLVGSFWGLHAAAGACLYVMGGAAASPFLAAFTCTNFAVQCFGGMKFNHKTKVLFERTFAAAKDAPDMESAVFWTGQLARLMKEHNPLFLAKNRTDLFNSEKATHLDTVARHLQEAAAYAGKRIAEDVTKNPMGFTQKDIVINGFLDKAKADLDTFIERWNAPASDFRNISAWTAGIASLPWIIPLLTKIL
jgi:hypothetical protein